jgi:murein DD-endopeptidase MepM/ murein hydrolase activator NlpD
MTLPGKDSFFSIVIMPPSGGRSWCFRFSRTMLVLFVVGGVSLTCCLLLLIYTVGSVGIDVANYRRLQQESTQHRSQMNNLQTKFKEMKSDIEILLERESEIRELFGSRGRASASVKSTVSWDAVATALNSDDLPSWRGAVFDMGAVLGSLKQGFIRLSQLGNQYRVRYAFTPSIWPVFGNILSDFGWRIHPVTGVARLHKGVDIPSWTGAPIKSAADGLIVYAGWSSGFGNVVVIDHNFGFRTIYAHASRLLVARGDLVRKGQLIAQVGSTGLSTGPHVHYEVRRWKQPVQPRRYLDMDMFTASIQVW